MNTNWKKFRGNNGAKSASPTSLKNLSELGCIAQEAKRRMMDLLSATPPLPNSSFDKLLLNISE